jgi:hypothetical protein
MSGLGLEIELNPADPYYPPPRPRPAPVPVRTEPMTPGEKRVGFLLAAALIGVIGYAVYKSPKSAWRPRPRYRREPGIRIRL